MRRDFVWQLATKYEQEYKARKLSVEHIVELALSNGFFSVWVTIFKNYPEIREALVENFPGTTKGCLDNNFGQKESSDKLFSKFSSFLRKMNFFKSKE